MDQFYFDGVIITKLKLQYKSHHIRIYKLLVYYLNTLKTRKKTLQYWLYHLPCKIAIFLEYLIP